MWLIRSSILVTLKYCATLGRASEVVNVAIPLGLRSVCKSDGNAQLAGADAAIRSIISRT
jgi:hypothetical protein